MKITVKNTEHVAKLARLDLSEQEKEQYTESLNAILGYMEILNRVDTTNVEPTAHVLKLQNVFRKDEICPCLDKDLALSNATDEENGCFRVPRIV